MIKSAVAVAGMEFYDVTVKSVTSSTDTVGGILTTTAILTLGLADGTDLALTLNNKVDVAIRYGEYMRLAKKVRVYHRGQTKAASIDGVVVSQQSLDLDGSGADTAPSSPGEPISDTQQAMRA